MSSNEHQLITRRRSVALLSSSAAGLLIAGKGGFGTASAKTSDGDDYVAVGAELCTLTAEQEEGPFYVAVDDVREDIVMGQTGLPLQLEITIINSQTCRPLKHAAVDIWHCNASGVYSDISSENTVGKIYLRGTLTGGHIAHTGQMFPLDAVYEEVYKLSPYRAETATIVTHTEDRVWTDQHGSEAQLKITKIGNRLSKGLTASVTLAVDPSAAPALIGATSGGTGSSPIGTPPSGR